MNQAELLAQATGMTVEQAAAFLQAQEALQAGMPLGTVMRCEETGQTATRVTAGPGGVPVWSIVPADSPWSIEHKPVDLPAGKWVEWGPKVAADPAPEPQ